MPHRRSISPTKYKNVDSAPDIIEDISNLTHPDYIELEDFEEHHNNNTRTRYICWFLLIIFFWKLLQNSQPGNTKDSAT